MVIYRSIVVKNRKILLHESFTACMPLRLLVAYSFYGEDARVHLVTVTHITSVRMEYIQLLKRKQHDNIYVIYAQNGTGK